MQGVRFVVGKVRRHLLRAPSLAGCITDERTGNRQVTDLAFRRDASGGFYFEAPDQSSETFSLSAEAARALSVPGVTALVGWPETIVIVRRGGTILYGEGDILHFGELAIDEQRVLRCTGFDYLAEHSAEVKVHLSLEERSTIDPGRALKRLGFDAGADRPEARRPRAVTQSGPAVDEIRLGPGQRTRFGPYELVNERTYNYERRPIAGQSGHGYFLRLRRLSEELVAGRATGVPDPLDVSSAGFLISLARDRDLLSPDEALWGEPLMREKLRLYEGPQATLENELAAVGPRPATLRWRGDTLEAWAARVARSAEGACVVGRGVVSLTPTGLIQVRRESLGTLPGRLRRTG